MPSNIQQADAFFRDTQGYLKRYQAMSDTCWEVVKVNKLKNYNDLRTALECILKSAAAIYLHPELSGEKLYKALRKYSHNISDVINALESHIEIPEFLKTNIENINNLPYALRYSLDAEMFLELYEDLFRQTANDEAWLDQLKDAVVFIKNQLNQELQAHSRIVSSSELMEEIVNPTPRYNCYR